MGNITKDNKVWMNYNGKLNLKLLLKKFRTYENFDYIHYNAVLVTVNWHNYFFSI